MKIQASTNILVAAFSLVASASVLAGCSNVGDENPISPDKMEQIRKQEADQRGNFQPKGGPAPTTAGSTGSTTTG